MEMLAFPDIKTRGNGQIGKKRCRQKKGMSGNLADIDMSARHVANMSLTLPTKDLVMPISIACLENALHPMINMKVTKIIFCYIS